MSGSARSSAQLEATLSAMVAALADAINTSDGSCSGAITEDDAEDFLNGTFGRRLEHAAASEGVEEDELVATLWEEAMELSIERRHAAAAAEAAARRASAARAEAFFAAEAAADAGGRTHHGHGSSLGVVNLRAAATVIGMGALTRALAEDDEVEDVVQPDSVSDADGTSYSSDEGNTGGGVATQDTRHKGAATATATKLGTTAGDTLLHRVRTRRTAAAAAANAEAAAAAAAKSDALAADANPGRLLVFAATSRVGAKPTPLVSHRQEGHRGEPPSARRWWAKRAIGTVDADGVGCRHPVEVRAAHDCFAIACCLHSLTRLGGM